MLTPAGSEANYNKESCLPCSPGTYRRADATDKDKACQLCAAGHVTRT